MRARFGRVALVAVPVSVALVGCSVEEVADRTASPVETTAPSDGERHKEKKDQPPAVPKTPAEFLERAREAMAAETGWTFSVKGEERLVLQGQGSVASYTATMRRTQDPEALHSTGTIVSKGASKPEEVFVVDGVGYVKEGGAGAVWKKGPVTDPDIANKVEDPVDSLTAFEGYAKGANEEDVELAKADGEVRLRVRTDARRLSEVNDRPAVKKAARELEPTLAQLRKSGVAAGESQITLHRLEEVLILDAETFRVRSHRWRFSILIPYQGQAINYSQDVREDNRGVFDGSIRLPSAIQ